MPMGNFYNGASFGWDLRNGRWDLFFSSAMRLLYGSEESLRFFQGNYRPVGVNCWDDIFVSRNFTTKNTIDTACAI